MPGHEASPIEAQRNLLESPAVLHSVRNSVKVGFDEMKAYALQTGKPVPFIGQYFLYDVVPYLKSPSQTIGLLPEPNSGLKEFWHETSTVCCYRLGALEKEFLSRDGGAPILFMTELEASLRENSSYAHLASQVQQLLSAVRENRWDEKTVSALEKRFGIPTD